MDLEIKTKLDGDLILELLSDYVEKTTGYKIKSHHLQVIEGRISDYVGPSQKASIKYIEFDLMPKE